MDQVDRRRSKKLLAKNTCASVIVITETWLDESVQNGEIQIDGYTITRQDRNRCGGGVLIYVNNSVAYTERSDLRNPNLEAVWLELLLPKTKPILLGGVYRPPSQSNFIEEFEKTLSDTRLDCETIILGDINICMLDAGKNMSSLACRYSNILQNFGLEQIVSG